MKKKGIIVGLGMAALLAMMVWADREFPVTRRAESRASGTANDASLPSVAAKDLNDHEISLSQYKGRVVLVNFWATWCEPCRVEIPWMIEFQRKYGLRGFTILGVSMDEEGKAAVAPFIDKERFDVDGQKEAMNYPILLGNNMIGAKFGGILGLPTSMLFTREGQKVKTITGLIDRDDVAKAIEGQL